MRLLNDCVLIELEEEKKVSKGGIISVGPQPVRIAVVLATGPGRRNRKGKLIPTQVKPGERFPFLKAATDTKGGRELAKRLPEGQNLIRESDILFVIDEGDPEITL